MRYAIVSETYPPEVNGVALTVQGLETGLRKRGHAVEVIRPRQDKETSAERTHLVRSAGLPRYPGLKVGLVSARSLERHWAAHRPDAIYIATEGPLGWSAMRAARAMGIPVATGFHTRFDHYMRDYGLAFLGGTALRWLRRFHNGGQATLVPTVELRDFLTTQQFANPMLLARAVDTAQFDPGLHDQALRETWGAAPGAMVAIHVGRIAAEKNLPLAVKAFRTLQRARPDARFVWVGDGPERAALAAANPDFVFCGVQRGQDLARHFASADLFLFPSQSETFGNVTLEAMASGIATVAFDSGAAREHLRNGVDGAAVTDDAGFLAAATQLAGDDSLRRLLGLNARRRIEGLRPEQVAEDFDHLLRDLALTGDTHVAALA